MKQSASASFKFGLMTGILAMFLDAAIGHGLFWQNDPFWSYWFVDGLLITTIVGLGTTIIGIGIWQGFVLMAAQTLSLEIYYQFLSPVGLPREPYWLSRFEIWTSGLPIHYLTYTAGFLLALWIWRRRKNFAKKLDGLPSKKLALFSVATAGILLVLDSLITQGLLLGRFAGITFLVHRLVLSIVFVFFWCGHIGFDAKGLVAGGLLLGLIWSTFNMYLGALGLPNNFPYFLSYDVLWSRVFPGALVSSMVGFLIARSFAPPEVKSL